MTKYTIVQPSFGRLCNLFSCFNILFDKSNLCADVTFSIFSQKHISTRDRRPDALSLSKNVLLHQEATRSKLTPRRFENRLNWSVSGVTCVKIF